MNKAIDVHDEGPVRVLVVNNPDKRNAVTGRMATDLRAALEQADADTAVRCVVVTGAGTEAFSAGHDLHEVLDRPETASDPVANAAFTMPAEMATPVIAAVNGAAYAAGFILALNCDLRVVGDNARFGAVGARIGLVPVGGQLSRLLHLVGYPVAFRMLVTAEPMTAQEALAHGFVTEVCPPPDTVARAVVLAERICAASPAAVAAIKIGLATTIRDGQPAGKRAEVTLAEAVRQLPDGAEGVRSVLERRDPVYPDVPSWLDLRAAT